jgi:AbrB family looped-hinge helix DNA binding protein
MKTAVSKRGQTVVPAEIRNRYGIETGSRLQWIDIGGELRVVPIPLDPVAALRGSARGFRLRKRLLKERRKETLAEIRSHGASSR